MVAVGCMRLPMTTRKQATIRFDPEMEFAMMFALEVTGKTQQKQQMAALTCSEFWSVTDAATSR